MKHQVILCIILLLVPTFVFAGSVDFARTLKIGMHSDDVRELQKILNADLETRIAESGVGSPGNETDYFGPATKRALIKFQEKYRGDILVPAGLVSGTGVFGAKTRTKVLDMRQKLNARGAASPASAPIMIPTQSVSQIIPVSVPAFSFFSTYYGEGGSILEIAGENFASKNSVYFGDIELKDITSKNGTSMRLQIPNLMPGVYTVNVVNEKGKNREDRIFAITKKGAVAPKVESASPNRVSRGNTLVLRGFGFAQKNVVRSGAGDFPAELLGDGSLLVHITESSMSFVPKANTKKTSVPVWLYVVNENGVSNAFMFTLEL